jgi:hypothetical protein
MKLQSSLFRFFFFLFSMKFGTFFGQNLTIGEYVSQYDNHYHKRVSM